MADPEDGLPTVVPGQEAELVCEAHEDDGVRVFWDGELIIVVCRTCEDVLQTLRFRERVH